MRCQPPHSWNGNAIRLCFLTNFRIHRTPSCGSLPIYMALATGMMDVPVSLSIRSWRWGIRNSLFMGSAAPPTVSCLVFINTSQHAMKRLFI